MIPVLLTRGQISDSIWDKHISRSRQCVIYALSWYLDIVCEQWQALVWPSATDFSVVMPLPVRRKFGQRLLYQPLFCQYLGIFSSHDLTPVECSSFLKALASNFPYISNYTFNPENFALLREALPGCKGFDYKVNNTHWLKLGRPYADVYAGYQKDRKANLRKGWRANWQIVGSDDFKTLIKLFKENHARRIGKIKDGAYPTLERLGKKCLSNETGMLLYAQSGAQVCAGVLLTHYRGRTIYLFNAANDAGRKGNVRLVMLDAYLRENAATQSVFDFESPQEQSIAAYYAGFGGVATPFFSISRNALPFPFRQIQGLRKWLLIRTRQYLSAGLCRILNPFPASRF